MKTPLVVLNLLHQPVRTLVAILGVAFAVLLVFMQLGFYGSAETAANTLFHAVDFDLVLLSSNYLNTTRPRSFPLRRIYQAKAHRDVDTVAPLYIDWQTWRIQDPSHQRRAILVLAFNLDDPVFRAGVFRHEPGEQCLARLHAPDTVLMDSTTRDYFGPRGVGQETELNDTRIRVVGRFTIGTGYGADGMVLTSARTYSYLTSPRALDRPAFGLIRLKPAARGRAAAIGTELQRTLYAAEPRDEVRILTRAEIEENEREYWMHRTSVGIIFQMGVLVALIVGVIFVYQVIATDISDHFAEFATLRAIGYTSCYLSGVVLRQALVLAVLGYVPAFVAALGLYALGRHEAKLLLDMTPPRAAGVLLLAIVMCSLSGLLALRKVKAADPADLF
ncbi:MAG TPA: FtsX-like permease family protein [Gemmataceae bacterium]|nr:FtsX-like permease family protein [Gemmataceae bacterium]